MPFDFSKPLSPQIDACCTDGVCKLDLETLTDSQCITILQAIPVTVTQLSLISNHLHRRAGVQLVNMIALIPATVIKLDLAWNDLNLALAADLVTMVAAIPATVTQLSLRGNSLWWKTGPELVKIVAAIPATITELDLATNRLGFKSSSELVNLIAAIPESVTQLDFHDNGLDYHPLEQIFLNHVAACGRNILLDEPYHTQILELQQNRHRLLTESLAEVSSLGTIPPIGPVDIITHYLAIPGTSKKQNKDVKESSKKEEILSSSISSAMSKTSLSSNAQAMNGLGIYARKHQTISTQQFQSLKTRLYSIICDNRSSYNSGSEKITFTLSNYSFMQRRAIRDQFTQFFEKQYEGRNINDIPTADISSKLKNKNLTLNGISFEGLKKILYVPNNHRKESSTKTPTFGIMT